MPCLSALLAEHRSLLVLDAASTRIQVGWLRTGEPAQWIELDDEANVAVFRAVERLPGLQLDSVGAFVFCEGPGSILGIRTVAMALRTWTLLAPRAVYHYCSLALVAHASDRPDLNVIADARRDTWHVFNRADGLRRLPPGELRGALVTPAGFRSWSPLPPETGTTPYAVGPLLEATAAAELFSRTEAADAFLHEEPSYATWTPQIHRAPAF